MISAPKIDFHPLTDAQFGDYRAYFIADYGQEIALNYRVPLGQALAQAEAALAESFPDGKAQPGQRLLSIELSADPSMQTPAQPVGYFWLTDHERDDSVFINDFMIFAEQRNKGLGRAAMGALERQLKGQGVNQLKLRVAFENSRALALYQAVGFNITGLNMAKKI